MSKLLVCLVSCSLLLRCNNFPCSKNHISPAFIGYSRPDIDTLIFKAYTPNDNYQHLADSFMVTDHNASIYTTSNDTTIVYVNDSNPNRWISAGFDWKIYVPAKNKTILISDIVSPQTEGSKKCLNPVNSFVQDGQVVSPVSVYTGKFYTSGYLMYVHL
jgi:phenylpyruvate tautomerase PptA (4-oxalocrotonate tautomerase family)